MCERYPASKAAGLTDVLPLGGNRSWGAAAKGRAYTRDNPPPEAFVRIVSDGYLRAMGIPCARGAISPRGHDRERARVIVINETLARTLWPEQDPLGQS